MKQYEYNPLLENAEEIELNAVQENGAYKISSAKLLDDLKNVKEFHYVK